MFRALVGAAALVAVSAGAARAQVAADSAATHKPTSPAWTGKGRTAGGPDLTPEQKAKLTAINERHADETRAVGDLFRTDPDAAIKRMIALRARMQGEVRAVLTPEQRAIFDRNVAEMNAQMDARLSGPPHK